MEVVESKYHLESAEVGDTIRINHLSRGEGIDYEVGINNEMLVYAGTEFVVQETDYWNGVVEYDGWNWSSDTYTIIKKGNQND